VAVGVAVGVAIRVAIGRGVAAGVAQVLATHSSGSPGIQYATPPLATQALIAPL